MGIVLFIWLQLSISSLLPAKTLAEQLYTIDLGYKNEDTLLLFMSGKVLHLKKIDEKYLIKLNQLKREKKWFTLSMNEKKEISSLEEMDFPSRDNFMNPHSVEEDYFPTILENSDEAKRLFHLSRRSEKDSQCFNRAHIWAFEWFKNEKRLSNKTWIFFTRKYIRRHHFEWWFHVAPSFPVKERTSIKEKIFDIKYSKGPLDLKNWTDIFMRNKTHCPKVSVYSDYANYPETGWCYVMRTSMFFYWPLDIERKEIWGLGKSNWSESELNDAYLDVFGEQIKRGK